MVQCSEGGTVSIVQDGEKVIEYGAEVKKVGRVETHTCYIEARQGAEYQVKIDNIPVVTGSKFGVKIYVDGKWADEAYVCISRKEGNCHKLPKHSLLFTGFDTSQTDEERVVKAFTFDKIYTTDNDSARRLPSKELEHACTIRVELDRMRRIGHLQHDEPKVYDEKMHLATIVGNDTKPAAYGLSTRRGKERVYDSRLTCNCDFVKDPKRTKHVVIFKYLPHSWLVAKGFKQDVPYEEDDDCIIDVRRTERSAEMLARRREREALEALANERNVRVKSESQVSEVL